MKIACLMCVLFTCTLSASVYPQQKMTLKMGNVPLKAVFEEMRRQTQRIITYNNEKLNVERRVDANFDNVDISEILRQVLTGSGMEFRMVDDYIVILPAASNAQQNKKQTIRGQVTDAKGGPLAGVTVLVDSTQIGTSTDSKGQFSLSVNRSRGNLRFTSVGYKTRTVAFTSATKYLTVKLDESTSSLDEVHVVAYGTTNKREMTGAVSVIKAEALKDIPSNSIANLLQGRVAGMDVTNISGAPGGGGTQITLRGYNSLSVESGRRFSNPLWVIDGVPMSTFTSPVTGTNGLADLNPEVIESIQVLKDASATSLYGSRAANGVIIVTTKKGRKNQDAQFDVNFSYSYNFLPAYPEQTGGRGERQFRLTQTINQRQAYKDYENNTYVYPSSMVDAWGTRGVYDGFWGDGSVNNLSNGNELQDSLNSFYNNSTNFFKYYYQAAKTFNANIQTSGGSERMTYSMGLGYYDETGILKGTGYNRINIMGNFTMNPVKPLSLDFRAYFAFSDRSRGVKNSGFSKGNEIETVPGDAYKSSTLFPGENMVSQKALEELSTTQEKNNSYRVRGSFGMKVDVLPGLNITNTLSLDYSQNQRNLFKPAALSSMNYSYSNGEVGRNYTVLDEALLNYTQTFDGKHKLEVMGGWSYQYDQYNYVAGEANNGPSDYVHYVTKYGWPSLYEQYGYTYAAKDYQSDFTEKKMTSLFARVNYNYAQRYMASLTLRRDGSSVFGRNLRWATFPSVALAWNFSSESFMKGLRGLDFGKLRASYGISGNQFYQPYLAYGILEGSSVSYDGNPIIAPNTREGFYNPNLGWEETTQYDLGIDLTLLNYRLNITADYYYRYTEKMLNKTPIPGNYSGYSMIWRNAGALSNEGLEFDINYDIFRRDNVKWNISLNLAKNWNRVKKTYNNRDMSMSDVQGNSRNYIIGKPVGNIMGYKTNGFIQNRGDLVYMFRQDGSYRPIEKEWFSNVYPYVGDLKMVDVNGDGYINSVSDAVYLGSSLPTVYGGIVNAVTWHNFDLNMLWSFSLGRDMIYTLPVESMGMVSSTFPIFLDTDRYSFWTKEGDQADYPLIMTNNYNDVWSSTIDRYVEKVNYLKLKTLTLGYNLPTQWARKCRLRSIRVFVSGENLLTWTNYSGLDPETVDINTGIDDGKNYPLARKFTAGITVKF